MLLASSSFAIIDPDYNMMGIYFDELADFPCLDGATPYSTHTLYLTITNPDFNLLLAWEAGYDVLGSGLVLSTVLPPQNLPLDFGDGPGNHIVGFGEPMIMGPVNIIATISVLYTATEYTSVDFILHGSNPGSLPGDLPVVLLPNDVLMTLGLSAADGLVAQINGGCMVVATENVNFGTIKSLYR